MSKDSPIFSCQVPHELASSLRDSTNLLIGRRDHWRSGVFIEGFMQAEVGWSGLEGDRFVVRKKKTQDGTVCVCCSTMILALRMIQKKL